MGGGDGGGVDTVGGTRRQDWHTSSWKSFKSRSSGWLIVPEFVEVGPNAEVAPGAGFGENKDPEDPDDVLMEVPLDDEVASPGVPCELQIG